MKEKPAREDTEPEDSTQWHQGVAAYNAGKSSNANPYKSQLRGFNQNRFRWFVGWLDQRTKLKFG